MTRRAPGRHGDVLTADQARELLASLPASKVCERCGVPADLRRVYGPFEVTVCPHCAELLDQRKGMRTQLG